MSRTSRNVVFECSDIAKALKACAAAAAPGQQPDFSSVLKFDNHATSSKAGKFINMTLTVNGVTGSPNNIHFTATQSSMIKPPDETTAAILNSRMKNTKFGGFEPRYKVEEAEIGFYPYTTTKQVNEDGVTWAEGETPATPDDFTDIYAMMYYMNIAFQNHIAWMIANRMIVTNQEAGKGISPGGVIHNNTNIISMIRSTIQSDKAPPEKFGKALCAPNARCKIKFNPKTLAPVGQIYDKTTEKVNDEGVTTMDLLRDANGQPVNAMNIHDLSPSGSTHEGIINMFCMLTNFGITLSRNIKLDIITPHKFDGGNSIDPGVLGFTPAVAPEPLAPPVQSTPQYQPQQYPPQQYNPQQQYQPYQHPLQPQQLQYQQQQQYQQPPQPQQPPQQQYQQPPQPQQSQQQPQQQYQQPPQPQQPQQPPAGVSVDDIMNMVKGM